jgi:class 3 adenylate cyclase
MKKAIQSLHKYFIHERYTHTEHEYRKARIVVNTTLITSLFALFFLGNTIQFEMPHAFWLMIVDAILFALMAWLLRWGVPKNTVTHIYVLVATVSTFINVYFSGGLYGFDVVWFTLGPVCGVLLGNKKIGWFWLVINLIAVLTIGLMHMNGYVFPFEINPEYKDLMFLNSYMGVILIILIVTIIMEKASVSSLLRLEEKNIIINEEKKRSDDLISNILPAEVIEELKVSGHSKARLYTDVTVLFTDFVNFTKISETMGPEELVAEIDVCFKAFDAIVERNGLEKIKTIGDAYLAVCGLPQVNKSHAINSTQAAIEMVQFIAKRKTEGGKFNIRLGMHSGPLVAGIVGVKKFAYDIWGDTVNTASRMETSGEEGKINISNATYELVKEKYNCTARGMVEAKNKGMIDMYFVDS